MNVLYTVEGNIGIATLNRPEKLNALDSKTRAELKEIVERAEKEVRVLIITGSGRAFAAGADINELVKRDPLMAIEASKLGTELFARIEELEIPVIAAINGLALGGGFGQPEINIGIFPGAGGTQRLPRLVGMGMAKKMVFTGEMISAEEAYRLGLVEELVEPDKLMDRAKEIASKIAEKSAVALKLAKRALNASMNTPLREGLRYEASLFSILFASIF
ncbi:MAG: enoyl-CoA hydratase [Archaeoglobaceae archaeon]|nr:enoyl-CoA hydratase [Archaeoglobaceae archaeon]